MRERERESNFELLRIIAMSMVVLLHCNFVSIGNPTDEEMISHPIISFMRYLFEQLCIVGVNVFVLISGWFGIKPQPKGFCKFLYQIFFWGVIALLISIGIGRQISYKDVIYYFYFGSTLWFIPSYIILYFISPVLNAFIEYSSKRTIILTLISFFSVEFAFGWFRNVAFYYGGFSALSFIGLYLLGRFIHSFNDKWGEILHTKKTTPCIVFIICTLFPICIFYISGRSFGMHNYASPFVIISAVSLLYLFSLIRIKSNIINIIASSSFAVYLFHENPFIRYAFREFNSAHYSYLPFAGYLLFAIAHTVLLFIFCVPIDRLRKYSWDLLCKLCINKATDKISLLISKYLPNE